MKLTLKKTQLENSEAVEEYTREKINSLDKLAGKFGESVEAWVEIGRATRHHQEGEIFRAEVDLRVPGKILRAEAETTDVYRAVDEVKDELERQLREYRGKLFARFKRGARLLKDFIRFGRFKSL